MRKFLLLKLCIVIIISSDSLAQVNANNNQLTIKPFIINKNQKIIKNSVYNENYNYTEFILDKNELGKITQNTNRCNIELTLSNNKTLIAVLNKFDIWDKNFEVKNEKGEKIMVDKGNVFQGYLKDDTTARVAVSIFKDEINILIETKTGKYNLHSNSQNNTYKFEDIINAEGSLCPVNDKADIHTESNTTNATIECKTFTIHVVTDLNLLSHYLGNTSTVYQRVVTIFNQMILPYQAQNVGVKLGGLTILTASSPFNYTNNSTLLNSFGSWYYTNISSTNNMGHLFTTVEFGGVIGTAWVNNICSPNVSHTGWSKVDDYYGYLVVAHEIGHNLGSSHTNSGSIMDPYVNSGSSFDAPTGTLFRNGLSSCGVVDNSPPTDLQTNYISTTTASISWTRSATSVNYSPYYRKVGDVSWTALNSGPNNGRFITGLLSGVNYEWIVQGDCSGFTSPQSFVTLVDAYISAGISNPSLCPGVSVIIDVYAYGEINAGNLFTAQLSDISGSFSNPVTIGTLLSKYSDTMRIEIPKYFTAGTGYKIRIISSSPSVIGAESNININPAPLVPVLTLSSNNLFCNNNPVSITASNCSGTISWNSPISSTGNTVSIIPANNTSYAAKCTGSNGCFSESNTPLFKKVEPGTKNAILQWEKSFGGTADDKFHNIAKTADGGYLLSGYSFSGLNGNRTQSPRGAGDGVLIKIDGNGNRLWEKVFGGVNEDILFDVLPTSDNNFLIVGQSFSGVGFEKQSINKGDVDSWIIKINPNGDIIWEVSLGSNAGEYTGGSVAPTADGGFIVVSSVGNTGPASVAANGDRSQNLKNESWDYWIFKQKVWDKIYGGLGNEFAGGIVKATDNSGYYIVGQTNSASGAGSDLTTSARHDYDGWLLKIDNNGNKIFDKVFSGGTERSPFAPSDFSNENLRKIKALPDGNYLIQGFSNNHAGNEKSENSMGGLDMWLIKIAPDGTKISDKVFGGLNNEYEGDMIVLNDGNILLSSSSKSSFNVDKNDALKGTSDAWLLKLDPSLNIIWSQNFGGAVGTDPPKQESIYRILNDGNDNFIVVGWANEAKGDREDAFGLDDAWVMKITIPSLTKPTISANTALVCPGESIILTANGCVANTVWANGSTSNTIVVTPNSDNNTYRVNCLTNANACIGLDSDVFRVSIASNDLTLTGTAISGNKQVKGNIVSKEIINSGINVNYKAGKSILLDKNQSFEAKSGSVFKAEIATCNLEDGLVGYFPFNNNALDLSNNNHNGTLYGALFTKDRFGKSNAALQFNGINQYLTLGNWFNFQNFSISYWINTGTTQANAYASIIENNHDLSRSWYSQQQNTSNNQYYFGAVGSPGNSVSYNLEANTWAHITCIKGNGFIKVFKNGVLIQNGTHTGNIPYDGTQLLTVGAWYNSGSVSRYWNGIIDDIRIYNKPLSDLEVATLFKSEAPNPSLSSGLFANYKFDGNANDISGKGNNGVINGGATFTTDRFGQANKALSFDGVDDYITVPNNNTLSGFNELTISAWVAHNQTTNNYGGIVTKWAQLLAQDTYGLWLNNVEINGANNKNSNTGLPTPNTIPVNTWAHIVYVHDGSGDKLFINGQLVASDMLGGNIIYSLTDMYIGADKNTITGTTWRFYKGKIDDIRIYSRALSPLEVIQLYGLEKP